MCGLTQRNAPRTILVQTTRVVVHRSTHIPELAICGARTQMPERWRVSFAHRSRASRRQQRGSGSNDGRQSSRRSAVVAMDLEPVEFHESTIQASEAVTIGVHHAKCSDRGESTTESLPGKHISAGGQQFLMGEAVGLIEIVCMCTWQSTWGRSDSSETPSSSGRRS